MRKSNGFAAVLKAKDDAAKEFAFRQSIRSSSSAGYKQKTNFSENQNVLAIPQSETTATVTKGTLPEIKQNMRKLGESAASDSDVKDLPDLTRLIGSPKQSPTISSARNVDRVDLDQQNINIKD